MLLGSARRLKYYDRHVCITYVKEYDDCHDEIPSDHPSGRPTGPQDPARGPRRLRAHRGRLRPPAGGGAVGLARGYYGGGRGDDPGEPQGIPAAVRPWSSSSTRTPSLTPRSCDGSVTATRRSCSPPWPILRCATRP